MAVSAEMPHFVTGTPMVFHSDNELTIFLPVSNLGPGGATNLRVTDVACGAAARVSPAALPFSLGNLAPSNSQSLTSRFDAHGLVVGDRRLLTVRGTYETAVATHAFALNRYIVVPSPSAALVTVLKAHVTGALAPGRWTYTVFNDEVLTSQQFVAAFSLDVVAPITATGAPPGWQVDTDHATYVLWSAGDQQPPYPNHIAPGASLAGFSIDSARPASEATPYLLTSWNHQTDVAGPVFGDLVLSPSAGD